MNLSVKIGAVIVAVIAISVSAAAQKKLEIDPQTQWEHPHSQIVVPTELAGLPRTDATEFAPDYLNVSFAYQRPDSPDYISLYIYRNTNGGVPVWFEQARRSIESRNVYANPTLHSDIAPYNWPTQPNWIGLRAFYDTPDSTQSASTGIALFSIDGWYVKIRATSNTRSAPDLSLLVDDALRGIVLPAAQIRQTAPVPVSQCAKELEFKKKAKDAKVDGGSALINALLGSVTLDETKESDAEMASGEDPVTWCRDSKLGGNQVVYRADGSENSFLIALGDSGMAVSVGPDLGAALLGPASGSSKKKYSITVITDNRRINYVPQNRLPSYNRVMEIINADRVVSSSTTWGKDTSVTLDPNSL